MSANAYAAQARALREEQRMVEAGEAMAQAFALAPQDRLIAFLHAQLRYELGYPAADLFAHAQALWPENPDLLRNRALAEASEGRVDEAAGLLQSALAQQPQWLEGHRILAALRWVSGDVAQFDASLAAAARAQPQAQGLWLGWFSVVAQHRDWPRARAIVAEAERHLGQTKGLMQARLFIATESGDVAESDRLLQAMADWADDFLQVARIRHALRRHDPAAALAIALPMTHGPLAGQVWPYVSTCWRLLHDPRSAWLDGDYLRSMEVGLSGRELTELAELLLALHTAQLPYAEQSVRGGTQTDRSLLLRHEPILCRTREALMAAVQDYVARLPAHDPAHPLLGRPRDPLRISGSWSVCLGSGGFNVTHSHPKGWISSAFYVCVPDEAVMGAAPAGHFHYGAPPPELGLDVPPTATVAPKAGHLLLFPSTLWHGTFANQAGRRLNIAFDIVPAKG